VPSFFLAADPLKPFSKIFSFSFLVIFLPSSNIQSPLLVITSPISASFRAYLNAFSNKLATISAITAYFAFNGEIVQSI